MSGKGVAQQLLRAAERAARQRGCDTMRLEVHETNHAAIARYRKQGYAEFGRHRRYYDDGGDALRFHKKFAQRRQGSSTQ
jgi:ribosomal protein S18 acetylase RimI-like enzyme